MFKPEEPSTDPKPEEHKEEDEDEEDQELEKEVIGNWKLIDLPEVPVVTGQENEEEYTKFKSKIYRFHDKQWKERGVGDMRFLKHKVTNMIRLLNRAEKTHRISINHLALKQNGLGQLQQLKTSNNSWTWAAQDVSDEQPKFQKFCAKFTSKEEYQRFEKVFNEACESNAKILEERKAKKEGSSSETSQPKSSD